MRREDFVVALSPLEKTICDALEPVLISEGFELVSIKIASSARSASVSLFVDTAESSRITVAQLESVNRLVGPVLDVMDAEKRLFRGSYNLEVSSPGLERPLAKKSHFEAVLGKLIRIKTNGDNGLAKNANGEVSEVMEDGFLFKNRDLGKTERVLWSALKGAHLVYVFASPSVERRR